MEHKTVLVIDTGAIIKGAKLDRISKEVWTVEEVLKEVRDRHSRDFLERYPIPIKTRTPTPEAFKEVCEFAKQSGDLSSLSVVDLKVLALTNTFHKELVQEMKDNGVKIPGPPGKSAIRNARRKRAKQRKKMEALQKESLDHFTGGSEATGGELPKEDQPSPVESSKEGEPSQEEQPPKEEEQPPKEEEQPPKEEEQPPKEEGQPPKEEEQPPTGEETSKEEEAPTEEQQQQQNEEHEDGEDTRNADDDNEGDGDDDDDSGWSTVSSKNSKRKKKPVKHAAASAWGTWISPENIHSLGPSTPSADFFSPPTTHSVAACVTTDYTMQNVLLQMKLLLISVDGMQINKIKHWALKCTACCAITNETDRKFCPKCGIACLRRVSKVVQRDGTVRYNDKNLKPKIRGTKFPIPDPKGGRHQNIILAEDQYQRELRKVGGHKKGKKIDAMDPDHLFFGTVGKGKHDVVVGSGKKNPNESHRRVGKKKKSKI